MRPGDSSAGRSASLGALLRWLDVGARVVLALACAALVGLGLVPRTGWYRPVTVLSGSMRPAFAPGDMVVVTPEPIRDVRVGQVISYRIPIADHHVESHRVIKVIHDGSRVLVRTKGDANATADPWTAQLHGTTAWRVRAVVPKLGRLIFWFRLPVVHLLTVIGVPFLLAILGVVEVWRREEHIEEPVDGATHAA